MNIYEEAWEALIKDHGSDKIMWNNFQPVALADLMLDYLDIARLKYKEHRKEIDKKLEEGRLNEGN